MNRVYLILLAFFMLTAIAMADPPVEYDKVPLPSGPILRHVPDFAHWQITFTYAPPPSSASPAATPPAQAQPSHAPKLLTMTRTKPRWHSVLVDASGWKEEMWFDGSMRFQVPVNSTKVIPLSDAVPSVHDVWLEYHPGHELPDTDWVSAKTYLGKQKGTNLLVFQNGNSGPTVWVDATTHFPVRWQLGQETRTIQFLDPPSEMLTLPESVANLSQGMKKLDALSRAAPPHL
jgi:hypothetical protein